MIFSLELTFEDLKSYNGKNGKPYYTSLKGQIFDVSQKEIYQKEGRFSKFVGHDCSLNMAKLDLDT